MFGTDRYAPTDGGAKPPKPPPDGTEIFLNWLLLVCGILFIVSLGGMWMAATEYKGCRKLYQAHADEPGWINTERCFHYQSSKYLRRCRASGKTERQCRGY
jgi:hypothetical protein